MKAYDKIEYQGKIYTAIEVWGPDKGYDSENPEYAQIIVPINRHISNTIWIPIK